MREEFKIPRPDWPDPKDLLDVLMRQAGAPERREPGGDGAAFAEGLVKAIAAISTHAWRAMGKATDPATKEVKGEYRSIHRHIEGIFECLKDLGVEVQDHTGAAFDYGLPLKVVTTQPTAGLTKERVAETIKPTIFWRGQIIQMGEVVIATPA
jgi:hypothetical protein